MKKRGIILLFIIVLMFVPNIIHGAEQPTYRALLIGNSSYEEKALLGPINDLEKMENALGYNYFGIDNLPFEKIAKKENLTKKQMIDSIKEEFIDAKEGDVSYFYYSGHGAFDEISNTAYLVGVDVSGLSMSELEEELGKIPGTVIVILDSCHSGGFIGRSQYSKFADNSNERYNDSVIDAFFQKRSRSHTADGKYKIITSASMFSKSYEIKYTDGWGWGGEFTRAFVSGNGYNDNFLADQNHDNNITLNEIYNYIKEEVKRSDVRVHPMADNYIIGSKFQFNSSGEAILWDKFHDISVNKIWKVEFNNELDDDSWKYRVHILDPNKNKIVTSLSKTSDGKGILIYPEKEFDYNSKYTIAIEENILSRRGSKLKDRVLIEFFTESKY